MDKNTSFMSDQDAGKGIVAKSPFERSSINRRNYTLSLSSEMLNVGMLSEAEFNLLQSALFEHLSRRIELYTGGESTSVKNSTAEKLFRSALYNFDLALLRIADTRGEAAAADRLAAIAKRGVEGFESLGYDGLRLNRELQLKARSMLRRLKANRVKTECTAYNVLINKTLDSLIRGYDDKFDASASVAVDYYLPTLKGSLRGITGILRLLTELECESLFVKAFPENELSLLNSRYKRKLSNLFEANPNLGAFCCIHAMLSLMSGEEAPTIPFDIRRLPELMARADEHGEAYSLYISCEHRLSSRLSQLEASADVKKALPGYFERLSAIVRFELANVYKGGELAFMRLILN